MRPGYGRFDIAGALDLASRGALDEAAQAAFTSDGTKGIVLDLADVTFIDSSGLGSIVKIAGEASDVGAHFALRRPSARVTRILEIAGLSAAWPIDAEPDA